MLNQKTDLQVPWCFEEEMSSSVIEMLDKRVKLDLSIQRSTDNATSDSSSLSALPHFDIIEREEDDLIELEEPTMKQNPLHQQV